ncbi:MAG TPA: hypothetical protein PLN31_20060, partial [Azoarcus taiwanensis]|nr:hypothetical protein [Azoarcus taiwanensis]
MSELPASTRSPSLCATACLPIGLRAIARHLQASAEDELFAQAQWKLTSQSGLFNDSSARTTIGRFCSALFDACPCLAAMKVR